MAKRNLLLVDADARSVRVLEVGLRKAGYSVSSCDQVDQAISLIELSEPDMIIADTRLPGKDGFELVAELRARPALAHVPLMFLSSDTSVDSKKLSLELGIEDYLTKPAFLREILARVKMVMERQEREGLHRAAKTRFAGSLEDMGLIDLLQTIDVSRKSGLLKLSSGPRIGRVSFQDGRVVDAELGALRGEAAVYRFLLWSEGSFELEFLEVSAEPTIAVPTQALLMEGVRRLDEWGRLQEQLPGLMAVLEVDSNELAARLGEIPDELNAVLRAFDGQRDLTEVLDLVGGDDLVTLTAVSKLFFDGFLRVRHRTEPSVDAQVGARSDPFLAIMPAESQPPQVSADPTTPDRPKSARSSVPAQFEPATTEPIAGAEVLTRVTPPRAGSSEPIVTAGRVPLAVVQLKRVPAITSAGNRLGPPAVESEHDMKQRGKRRAERESERGNVIPLHVGMRDSAVAKHDDDQALNRSSDRSAERSAEQMRGDSKRSDSGEHGLPSDAHELHHEDDHPGVRDFFASTPKSIAPSGEPWHDFDDEAEPHNPVNRRAMLWSGGILGVGLLLIGIFLLYNKVLMPTPEEFSVKQPIKLPTPDMLPQPPAAPIIAPEVNQPAPVEVAPADVAPAAQPVVDAPVANGPSLQAEAAAPEEAAAAAGSAPPAQPGEYEAIVAEARKLGFRKAAEDQYLKAIGLNPGGSEAISGLAMLYLNQGKNALARTRAEQALALNPQDDEGWIVLGAAQSALGAERLARDAYARCAALPSGKYVAECKRLLR